MNKSNGTAAELIFQTQCVRLDVPCSVPIVDKFGYDCIAGHERLRVQIKTSTMPDKHGRYKWLVCHGKDSKTVYTKDMIDIMALYIEPLDIWYIIPIEELEHKTVSFYPMKQFKYDGYREAWSLLQTPAPPK